MRKKVCVHTPSRYDSGCGCVVCVASKKCVKAQQVGRSLMTHVAFFSLRGGRRIRKLDNFIEVFSFSFFSQ